MNIRDTAASAADAYLITAADTDLATPIRGLYVGTTGNVRVTTLAGTDLVIPNVPGGFIIPLEIKRVWSTNTTASGFMGLHD